jgi:hypothetical protein
MVKLGGQEIVYTLTSVLTILTIIFALWFILWKLVLEPNPIVRDFFDLDRKPISKRK